jgi:hypothetical protein
MKIFSTLGIYISTEQGFLKASILGLGIPGATLGIFGFNEYGAFVTMIATVSAFLGSYIWGLIMWRIMFRELYGRKRALAVQLKFPDSEKPHI